MQEDIARLEEELDKIEQAIAEQEALRGVRPAAEVDAQLAKLQQKKADLHAKITITGDVSDSNVIIGNQNLISKITNFFGGSTEEQRTQRNRQIMLERVKQFWIEGVLEHSLHGQAVIELGMAERPDAVDNRPWDMVLQIPERPPRLLPQDTKIVDVFDEMEQTLLILGEPGSGKTTMLLELARDTIARAESDPTLPIPVVFNLSSWANGTLAEWLIDELSSPKYFIPKKIACSWVENDDLLPLLDGLDEVALERREACVKAINQFRQEHLMPLEVCSRIADYEALTSRLKLQGAVFLQPLTERQIDEYLIRAGIELLAVRKTLQHDSTLAELAQSPLMLSIMVLAYRGMSVEQLQPLDTVEARRQHIFSTYVERMFERRGRLQPYVKEQTKKWLSWLAQNMKQHSQKVFLIEQLQPSWLATRKQRWTYVLGSRLIGGIIYLVIFVPYANNDYLMLVIIFIVYSLTNSVIDALRLELNSQSIQIRKAYLPWYANVLVYVLMCGVMFGVIESSIIGFILALLSGLFFGLLFGLLFGLIWG